MRRLLLVGAVCCLTASLVTADTAPPPVGPTVASLVTVRFQELVQQKLVFPLPPSTPITPENQLGAIVNHFRALAVEKDRLATRLASSEQTLAMLAVSNDALTQRLAQLQAPEGLPLGGAVPLAPPGAEPAPEGKTP